MSGDIGIIQQVELARLSLSGATSRRDRSEIGQFFTPLPIACFMASLCQKPCKKVRILDPGAGVGTLFSALVQELLLRKIRPESIEVVAYETDLTLKPHLEKTMGFCSESCRHYDIQFDGIICTEDFILAAIAKTEANFFYQPEPLFSHVILNPPYKKINGNSDTRKILNAAGMETSNLYSAFVWLSAKRLARGGELVAITPRSFCNGPYFRRYRKALIDLISLRHVHVFESRREAFRDDSVLQENVIFYGVAGEEQTPHLIVSVSGGTDFAQSKSRKISFRRVILPDDSDAFIHLFEDDCAQTIVERISRFNTSLEQLGLEVSTGRVVDFRARDFLRKEPDTESAPLLYPSHFSDGFIRWPLTAGKKPNAIIIGEQTRDLLVTSGYYVLTKRFTAKEERRRVVAVVFDPRRIQAKWLGFENHLNYFHAKGGGIQPGLAKGLAIFLNSTLLDRHFRLFSGHTQVNATDLRKLRYPTYEQLLRIGKQVKDVFPDQQSIDHILEKECGCCD